MYLFSFAPPAALTGDLVGAFFMPKIKETAMYLTVKEVADLFRVAPNTVYRYISEGKLEAVTLGPGKALRVPQAAVDRFATPTT